MSPPSRLATLEESPLQAIAAQVSAAESGQKEFRRHGGCRSWEDCAGKWWTVSSVREALESLRSVVADAECRQSSCVACFATTDGSIAGAKGCHQNCGRCMTGGAAPAGCFRDSFTACAATTSGDNASVIG